MSQESPVVFIVDDDASVCESLAALIESVGWRAIIYKSARSFLTSSHPTTPNCLILDVNLPDLSGLELQELISTVRTEMPIIFVTGYGDVPMTVKAMKAGAFEFLMKPFSDDVLLVAVEQALQRSRSALDANYEGQTLRNLHGSLSRREQEVMTLVVAGLMNKQIAFELGISEITVKAHRGQVMRKMKIRTLADLVKVAEKLGIGR